jgi:hypothetical protein
VAPSGGTVGRVPASSMSLFLSIRLFQLLNTSGSSFGLPLP